MKQHKAPVIGSGKLQAHNKWKLLLLSIKKGWNESQFRILKDWLDKKVRK